MSHRLQAAFGFSVIYAVLAAVPAQAVETRAQNFALLCDGTTRTVVYNMTGLGTSVSRFIQGASFAVTDPRGGVKLLQLEVVADPTKIVVDLGAGRTTARRNYFGSLIQVSTNAAGNVAMQINGSCTGGGSLQGWATVWLFN